MDPGLYLDGLVPDYLVVRLIDPSTPTTAWLMPGAVVWGRFPILAWFYDGTINVYLTLPFYLVFGGTVLSIRLAHLLLSVIIVLVSFLTLRGITRSNVVATALTLALAIDPAFVYAFRTQAYIAAFPIVFTIAAIYLLSNERISFVRYFFAGLLLGISVWGYFIYSFVFPGILLFLLFDRHHPLRRRAAALLFLCIGGAVGFLPYFVGYSSMFMALGGFARGIAFLQQSMVDLKVQTQQSYAERLASVMTYMWWALTGEWGWKVIWHLNHPEIGQFLKVAGLFLSPLVTIPFGSGSDPLKRAFRLLGLAVISFIVGATYFGARLGGHHFVALLPLLYILAGVSAAILLNRAGLAFSSAPLFVGCAALLALNAISSWTFLDKLREDRGVDFYSRLVDEYPLEVLKRGDKGPYVFADWGGVIQFIYLTEGKIPARDRSDITHYGRISLAEGLCKFPEAKVVYLGADASKRGLSELQGLHFEVVSTEVLRDRAFEYAVIHIKPTAQSCK